MTDIEWWMALLLPWCGLLGMVWLGWEVRGWYDRRRRAS